MHQNQTLALFWTRRVPHVIFTKGGLGFPTSLRFIRPAPPSRAFFCPPIMGEWQIQHSLTRHKAHRPGLAVSGGRGQHILERFTIAQARQDAGFTEV